MIFYLKQKFVLTCNFLFYIRCSAPGGWSQVARKFMPLQGIIVGIDLASIKNV
jgi:hypothetical protein